mmetsp:Transcript_12345/g.33081  ORF Transcript_12345/g.33081 Transcript_12345/m.33081 type:complete len:96 (-) Transcript_12345:795-1082(-)
MVRVRFTVILLVYHLRMCECTHSYFNLPTTSTLSHLSSVSLFMYMQAPVSCKYVHLLLLYKNWVALYLIHAKNILRIKMLRKCFLALILSSSSLA